jgi:ABC-2 type transport system permease protein
MIFPLVLRAELLKLKRSKVTWVTFVAYTFMVAIAGSFLWMMKNPAVAQSIGLLGQKAKFAFGGQPLDWPTFMTFVAEMGGMGGLIMCSVIVTFIFGREYAEGTAKNLLAMPVPRSFFVLSKIVVAAAWFAVLTLWLVPAAALTGVTVGLAGLTTDLVLATTGKLLALAGMSLCCSVIVAWVAVQTRGYFAPLGFSIGTLAVASVFGHTGWGPWVPWSIVGLYSGAAGPGTDVGWGSAAVITATLLVGTALIMEHERRADNAQ